MSGEKIILSCEFTLKRSVLNSFFALVLPATPYYAGAAEIRALHTINQLPFKQISSFQMITGGSPSFSDGVYVDISVAENVNTAPAPDVALQLALVAAF